MTREDILAVAKPILFNTDMVRAILEDSKSATRRCIKYDFKQIYGMACLKGKWLETYGNEIPDDLLEWYMREICKPKYKPGDYLYVRETWSTRQSNTCMGNTTAGCPHDSCETANGPCFEDEYIYKATDSLDTHGSRIRKWYPSIHMPKEAARIFLRVTDVRVERLQDMTLDDFLAEGVVLRPEAFNDPENDYWQARKIFSSIWDSTILKKDLVKYGWDANPWEFAYEFERVEV